jgi:hypothetical protein
VTARDEMAVRDWLRRALALTGGDGVPSLPGLPIISRTVAPGYEVVGWNRCVHFDVVNKSRQLAPDDFTYWCPAYERQSSRGRVLRCIAADDTAFSMIRPEAQ